MLVLAIAGLAVVLPLAISLALHRTRAWWLAGALVIAAAAYLVFTGNGGVDDADSWALGLPDFAGMARDGAAAVLAVWGAIVLAITHLARRGFRLR